MYTQPNYKAPTALLEIYFGMNEECSIRVVSVGELGYMVSFRSQLSLEYNAVGMQLAKLPARQQPVCVGFEEGVFCRCVGLEVQAADASGYERR